MYRIGIRKPDYATKIVEERYAETEDGDYCYTIYKTDSAFGTVVGVYNEAVGLVTYYSMPDAQLEEIRNASELLVED